MMDEISTLDVLLVEDDKPAIEYLSLQLKRQVRIKCNLKLAETLDAAAEWVANDRPDVVLLSPSLGGEYSSENLSRAIHILHESPIVLVVTRNKLGDALAAAPLGVQDYVVKDGVDLDDLERALRFSIERHHYRTRLETHAALAHEHEREVREILDALSEPVFAIDIDGEIRYYNPAFSTLFDDQPPDKLTDSWKEVLETKNGGLVTLPPDMKRGDSFVLQRKNMSINGRPAITVALHASGEPGQQGVAEEAPPITEQRIARERLDAAGQITQGIAEDFTTRLGSIILTSELILQGGRLSGRDQARMVTIREEAVRGSHILAQVMDYTRKSRVNKINEDLGDLLESTVKLLEQALPSNIEITVETDGQSYPILGDAARLEQAIINMALNSSEAMPDGGRMVFFVERIEVEKGLPPYRDMGAGSWIKLTVSDTGVGIPEEALPYVFKPFFTSKESRHGTGMGLAQVYGLVKGHKGYIDVQSSLGEGTSFILYFQVRALTDSREEPPAIPDLSHLSGNKEKILIIESDESLRTAISDILEAQNYRVRSTATLSEAYAELNNTVYDLVLAGRLPENIDTIDLFVRLKDKQGNLAMVFMTGQPVGEGTQKLVKAGVLNWVQKPIDTEGLSRAVRDALKRSDGLPVNGHVVEQG